MHRQHGRAAQPRCKHDKPFGEPAPPTAVEKKNAAALFQTVRPLSSLVTGVLAASAAIAGQGRLSIRGLSAGLVMTALSMFGFAVNDILDYHQDRAAGIRRPVAAGELSRKDAMWLAIVMLIITFLFSFAAGPGKGILAITSVLLLFYSPLKRRYPLCKDVYVAGLCCFPLYYGVIVGGRRSSWICYAVLVCFVLGREIWMDSDELRGDLNSGVRTVAAIVGRQETMWLGKGLMLLAAAGLAAVTHGLTAVSIAAACFVSLACVFAWPGLGQSRRIEWSRGSMLLGAMAIACGCR
jgi:4-hydroxybenzoate polyprenyltransferase